MHKKGSQHKTLLIRGRIKVISRSLWILTLDLYLIFIGNTQLFKCRMHLDLSRSGIAVLNALVSYKLVGRKPLYISTGGRG